jgi:putative phage-type endonuclease
MSVERSQLAPPENVVVDYKDRQSWLAARKLGVGASEASALFACSPYESAYSLWAQKAGLVPPPKVEGEHLDAGHFLEPAIANWYEAVTKRELWTFSPYCIARHPRVACMFATPDRWVTAAPDRSPSGIVQIKNTASFMEGAWSEAPPLHIQIQVQHELAVTGREWAAIAVVIGGNKLRHWDIERNPDFIGELEAECEAFWRLVEAKEPPEADPHKATYRVLEKLHPSDNGEELLLDDEAVAWWTAMQEARQRRLDAEKIVKVLKAEEEKFDVRLRAAIGSATFGKLPDGRVLSLKTTARDGYTVEACTYRQLRLVAEKATGRRAPRKATKGAETP